jgi:integrase
MFLAVHSDRFFRARTFSASACSIPGCQALPSAGRWQPWPRSASRSIKKVIGLTVNAHLFRHVCAFLYLKAHPGDYETVRLLLGHTSLATTVRA